MYNVFRTICSPGDQVIVPTLCWVTYPEQIKLAGADPIFVSTTESNDFKLTLDDLERSITSNIKGIIINNPNNPTGSVYSKEELEKIARFALRNCMWVVTDEIYEKLIYDGKKHISLASLSPELKNIVITVNGLSKSYAMTGWRIGYAAGPQKIIKAMKKLQGHSNENINSIAQKAAIEALTSPQNFICSMREAYLKRRNKMVNLLNRLSGIKCKKSSGAFYVFPNVTGLYGTEAKGFKINN